MAKVVVKSLSPPAGKAERSSISEKRVVDADGRRVKVLTVDSNSESFSADLRKIFQRNVAKARRENMKRFGSPDRVRAKA